MRKSKVLLIAAALTLAIASPSLAMSKRHGGTNLHVFGSDDSQRHRPTSVPPAVPQPVPEPATILLLGAGLVGLAACSRKK